MKFDEKTGLLPAIIQDATSSKVLMLGYMNHEAFNRTLNTGQVTFWSRSKNRIWTKGETSGNVLHLESWKLDCDQDTLLIKARPSGPVCHTGTDTCWGESNKGADFGFLKTLESIIRSRRDAPNENSYTSSLFKLGTPKIAQKVGEEATELVIESMRSDDDSFVGEAADLLFHYLVLLQDRNMSLRHILDELTNRHQ